MQQSLLFLPENRVYTVTELNGAIRATLDQEFQDLRVSGEISGLRMAQSGHAYFTLKEHESQIRCVCFRSTYRYLKFKPVDGIAVVARGRLDVFEARGEYQLMVEGLDPQGHGALQVAFEKLKLKLRAEGLFEAERKRAIPKFPRHIAMVTSPRGAVVSDMIQVLERRFPGLQIRIFPAQVQGEAAVEELCRGLEYFSRHAWADVVILARGGGSLEDLWSFNSEAVARAIAASSVPVISAVGHETDVTIADFVADLRAPTPSAAAEMLCCTRDELIARIAGHERQLIQAARFRLSEGARRVGKLGTDRAATLLHRQIGRALQRVDENESRLRDAMRKRQQAALTRIGALEASLRTHDIRPRMAQDRHRLERSTVALNSLAAVAISRKRQRVVTATAKLEQLSPLRILDRGYAIVRNTAGLVKSPADAAVNSEIQIRFAKGELSAIATEQRG